MVVTCCSGFASIQFILPSLRVNGNRLSPEPDRRSFATIYLDLLDQFPRWSQTGTVSTICLLGYFIMILVMILLIVFLINFWVLFAQVFDRPCLSEFRRINSIHLRGDLPYATYLAQLHVIYGIQFPTDFRCDFHGDPGMVPWTHLREPSLR